MANGYIEQTLTNTDVVSTTGGTVFNMARANQLSVQGIITDTPPSNASFSPSDVNTTDNTITETGHDLTTGLKVRVSNSGGGLPSGLSGSTDYFVIVVDEDTYKLASSLANAQAGTAIDITTQGTGTHTLEPQAVAGGNFRLQGSNDGVHWVNDSNDTFTTTAVVSISKNNALFRYYRINMELTSGRIDCTRYWFVRGDL